MNQKLIDEMLRKHELYVAGEKGGEIADFSYEYLPSADFQNVDLRWANFQGAYLRNANFIGADLRYADFSNADLSHAVVVDADLRGANLEGADLYDVWLGKSRLSPEQSEPEAEPIQPEDESPSGAGQTSRLDVTAG